MQLEMKLTDLSDNYGLTVTNIKDTIDFLHKKETRTVDKTAMRVTWTKREVLLKKNPPPPRAY